jgi:hypothetical protein
MRKAMTTSSTFAQDIVETPTGWDLAFHIDDRAEPARTT